MAIYHLSVKVISRARGQSVVATAAYRFGIALRDERYGVTHRRQRHEAEVHAEVMAPSEAPAWVRDRRLLWNRIEEAERRKDAQLARVVEIALPVELTLPENLALVRDYVAGEFVSLGMIADFCIRWDAKNPHAHILLTLRPATALGFGLKERRWNGRAVLNTWRASWADRVNEHLARAGHGVRIDHRTLEAQQLELTPARRVGVSRERLTADLPSHLAERISAQHAVAEANGAAILEDPTVALRALTHQRPIFTRGHLVNFLRSRTFGAAQFEAAYGRVTDSAELVAIDSGADADARFTTRDLLEAEKSLLRRATVMTTRRHVAPEGARSGAPSPAILASDDQRRVYEYLVGDGHAKAIVVSAGSDKVAVLACAHRTWLTLGFQVVGAAPSARAERDLETDTGIPSMTLAARERSWMQGLDLPARGAVLVIDGAETLALKQMERLFAVADNSRAKIVLLGDSARMTGMRIETPFSKVLPVLNPNPLDGSRAPS